MTTVQHHLLDHLHDTDDARTVARVVAEHRDLWAAHVRFDPAAPHHATVWADDRWEVSVGAWLPGQGSGNHQHVGRPGALLVLQGALRETTWHVATDGPAPGRRTAVSRVHAAGGLRTHGSVHMHDVAVEGSDPVVALQVHARP